MKHTTAKFFFIIIAWSSTGISNAFTISINGDEGTPGQNVSSRNCQQAGESSFTSDSSGTFYTDAESYAGGKSIELNIKEGSLGFGSFGGIINFPSCTHAGGRRLVKGEEIWVRLRIKFPTNFEFNVNGRNKFLRIRTFTGEGASRVSQGYNDLYLDAPPGTELYKAGGYAPFQYIYEGEQQWYRMSGGDFFTMGVWQTIEYYIRLDDNKGSENGNSMMRTWLNGNLIGETNNRNTLTAPDGYIESLYLFTYWDNQGSHITQKLWIDDLQITSDTPLARDAMGNPFIGLGTTGDTPAPPSNLLVQ